MIEGGVLAETFERAGVAGITTNPTIFTNASATGAAYEGRAGLA